MECYRIGLQMKRRVCGGLVSIDFYSHQTSIVVVGWGGCMTQESALVVFQDKKIRRIWHYEEWYFSVVDVVGALAESPDPRNYWKVLKHRLIEEGGLEPVTNCN